MKKYYFAVQTKSGAAHILAALEYENVAAFVRELDLTIARPCKTYAEAVAITEAWKKART